MLVMRSHFLLLVVFIALIPVDSEAQRSDFWEINFNDADSIAEFYADWDLKDPESLAEELTKDLNTDVEKFRSIFRWISDNIYYDLDLAAESKAKQQALRYKRKKLLAWRGRFGKKIERKLYTQQLTICEGYASLLERMSNHVGIACEKIIGYARTPEDKIGYGKINHAWNAVKLNNKWYLCDATWASSRLDRSTMRFDRRFDKRYFLTEPSLFIANHFPIDTSWTLLYRKASLKEFLHAPMKHSDFISNHVNTYSPAEGIVRVKKGNLVTFEFTSNIDLEEKGREVHFFVSGVIGKTEITKRIEKNAHGQYSLTHIFENRGAYKVDITIDGYQVLTYRIHAL
jgi:transglutaminase/protease-like cytokinesis protein 3